MDNIAVEVTTFRGASPEEDVKSRDFTINALLFDGNKVIDLVDGLKDLDDKTIRAIGNPGDRFKEDALRMIRAVRLSCQLNFDIDHDTIRAIGLRAELIQKTAPERIRDELVKILTTNVPSEGLRLLQSTGLLKYFLPELEACYKFDQRNPYHDKDVFDHIVAVVENTPNDQVLRLAALLHDIGKPCTFSIDEKGVGHFYNHNIVGQNMSRQILTRLKFDNKTIDSVGKLIREHMCRLNNPRLNAVKKLIQRTGNGDIGRLLDLQFADEAGSASPHNFKPFEDLKEKVEYIIEIGDPLHIEDLAIGGRDNGL